MFKHPDPAVQELLEMLEMQRETAMLECAALRVEKRDLAARLAVAEIALKAHGTTEVPE